MIRQNVQVLISAEEISQRVQELGRQIRDDYLEREMVAIGLLRGAYAFFADLTRAIDLDFQIRFMGVTSYGSEQVSSGNVKIVQNIDAPIFGKNVLIIEDIVDTGQTLARVITHMRYQSPASVRVCTLLDKPSRRLVDVHADYVGFTISDQFVVGYGMDMNGLYRNLPYVGVYNSV
ncbi:MAG: hypoxanthine phosphoribosyltransferase [Holophagales bacterium]|nr:hypoxanthine phosphoribosyltransferase [Holophagales bacterium]